MFEQLPITEAEMRVRTVDIEYDWEGMRMVGYFAIDDQRAGLRPGVLVCHHGPGLDNVVKESAERLAALGYGAFALDYQGSTRPMDQAMERLKSLREDPDRIRAAGRAGLSVLTAQQHIDSGRVAAIGYSFGGTMALELAREGADLKVTVGFHSGLATARPEDARNITSAVLVCIGSEDPFTPPEQRLAFEKEMRDGSVADWRLELYGGAGHAFTNRAAVGLDMPGTGYHAPSERRSWRSMLSLFDETLGVVGSLQ